MSKVLFVNLLPGNYYLSWLLELLTQTYKEKLDQFQLYTDTQTLRHAAEDAYNQTN